MHKASKCVSISNLSSRDLHDFVLCLLSALQVFVQEVAKWRSALNVTFMINSFIFANGDMLRLVDATDE